MLVVKDHVNPCKNMMDQNTVGQKYERECRRDVKWKNNGGDLRCRENQAMRS